MRGASVSSEWLSARLRHELVGSRDESGCLFYVNISRRRATRKAAPEGEDGRRQWPTCPRLRTGRADIGVNDRALRGLLHERERVGGGSAGRGGVLRPSWAV